MQLCSSSVQPKIRSLAILRVFYINNQLILLCPLLLLVIRHVVLAPSYFDAKPGNKFSGITDSIYIATNSGKKKDWERVKKQISMAIQAARSATLLLSF